MPPLLATESVDGTVVTAVGTALVVVIGALGAWVLKVKESHNALLVKLEELRQGGKVKDGEEKRLQDEVESRSRAEEFQQFQAQLKAARERIDQLERRDDEKSRLLAECTADRAQLNERIAWLELNPGKSPPRTLADGSGSYRPVKGVEGADL